MGLYRNQKTPFDTATPQTLSGKAEFIDASTSYDGASISKYTGVKVNIHSDNL